MLNQKYGVVYTPESLAEFVASLLYRFSDIGPSDNALILDPASGECALLEAARKCFGDHHRYIGIDVDSDVTERTRDQFEIIHNDTLLPLGVKEKTENYWRDSLHQIDIIIANPPWSSEKVYDRKSILDNC